MPEKNAKKATTKKPPNKPQKGKQKANCHVIRKKVKKFFSFLLMMRLGESICSRTRRVEKRVEKTRWRVDPVLQRRDLYYCPSQLALIADTDIFQRNESENGKRKTENSFAFFPLYALLVPSVKCFLGNCNNFWRYLKREKAEWDNMRVKENRENELA